MPSKRPIETLDFETDPFENGRAPECFAAGHYDGDEFTCFWDDEDDEGNCVGDVARFVEDRRAVIYAHNGGKFDFHYLLPYADSVEVYGSRIASMRIGDAELRDSFLILPVSLASMDKTDIDYRDFEWNRRNDPNIKATIIAYLRDDCRYLWEWVNEFENKFGRNRTLALAAIKQLKNTGYSPPRVSEDRDAANRPVYSGGRVSVFERGKIEEPEPLRFVDINSAYPFAMLYAHPYEGVSTLSHIPRSGKHAEKPYFAYCDVWSNGAIPVRDLKTGNLGYPVGELSGVWVSNWELEAGEETGTLVIRRVHECRVAVQTKSMADFVYRFYEQKKNAKAEGDKARELFAKLMLNSCYGKFAQNPRRFREFAIFHRRRDPGPEWRLEATFESSDWYIWSKAKDEDESMRFYNVLTAASITGFVRAHLWRAINASVGPIYCDTDSIICREFHGDVGDELGQWSVEAELSRVWVGGKKLYAGETTDGSWKTASKGARLSPSDIVTMVETGEAVHWANDAPAFQMGNVKNPRFTTREIRPT